jgi:hypothetical protein
MTSGTPVERVVAVLTQAGYRPVSMPLIVASVPFDFAAALIGAERALDLIIVLDTVEEPEARIRQKVEALSRALDVIGSCRPLTAVLAGPRPHAVTLDALGRVCRVLPVGTPVGPATDQSLDDWLAVLLPLHLPQPTHAVADPMGELVRHMPQALDRAITRALINGAPKGAEAVKHVLRTLVLEPLNGDVEKAVE